MTQSRSFVDRRFENFTLHIYIWGHLSESEKWPLQKLVNSSGKTLRRWSVAVAVLYWLVIKYFILWWSSNALCKTKSSLLERMMSRFVWATLRDKYSNTRAKKNFTNPLASKSNPWHVFWKKKTLQRSGVETLISSHHPPSTSSVVERMKREHANCAIQDPCRGGGVTNPFFLNLSKNFTDDTS